MPHAHSEAASGGLAPALVLALVAMLSLWAGAWLPTWRVLLSRGFERHLALLIGFSAGLMLATSLHDLIPHALESNPSGAMGGVAIGFFALYIVERATHFHACRHRHCDVEHEHEHHSYEHHGHEHGTAASHVHAHVPHAHVHAHGHAHHGHAGHGARRSEHADTMALAGMSVHNFADGLTTAVAFGISATAGLTVVLAIVLHQFAAGLSLGAIMLRARRSRARVLLSTLGAAAAIPVGVLFYHCAVPLQVPAQGMVLGIAAGSFLYVAACDLLPEAHAEDEGWSITAATLTGYALTLLARTLGGHAH